MRTDQRIYCWIVASLRAGGLQCAGRDTCVRWPALVRSEEVRGVGQSCRHVTLPVLPLSERARPTRHRQAGATLLQADLQCEGLSHAEIPSAAALLSSKIVSPHGMGQSTLQRLMRRQWRTVSSKTAAHQSRPEPWTASLPRQAMPGEAVLKVWIDLSSEKLWHQIHNDTITKLEHKCEPNEWLFISCRPADRPPYRADPHRQDQGRGVERGDRCDGRWQDRRWRDPAAIAGLSCPSSA